jgi:hypothetical protein
MATNPMLRLTVAAFSLPHLTCSLTGPMQS